MKWTTSLGLCTLLAWYSYRKKSLSLDGSMAAFLLGLVIFTHPDPRWSLILLLFYQSGSFFTKLGAEKKRKWEEEYVQGGQRNATQVFSNGLTGAVISLLDRYWFFESQCQSMSSNPQHWILFAAYVGHFACCAGDTWASELGILSKSEPFLITTFRRVPRGTNGGVSSLGLLASVGGGLAIGLCSTVPWIFWTDCPQSQIITRSALLTTVGTLSGLIGSLIDSLLGATAQRTVYDPEKKQVVSENKEPTKKNDLQVLSGSGILDNHQVNFISSLLTSLLAGLAMSLWLNATEA